MSVKETLKEIIRKYGIDLVLIFLFAFIVLANIRPEFLAMGNDNFAPELDPGLTLERSVMSPGWRTHRVLGIPSDSEQSDIFRTLIFYVLSAANVPTWLISQGYFFFTLAIGIYSAGKITEILLSKYSKQSQLLRLLGAAFYAGNLLTIWIYFFPVHLFVAAYSFLPFVIWRLLELSRHISKKNIFLLIIASLLLAVCALTATMFITSFAVILAFSVALFLYHPQQWKGIVLALCVIIASELFWILPFATYVKSNTQELRDSLINRRITTVQVENELKYNTASNTLRYFFSWIDTKEDGDNYMFKHRDWYAQSVGYVLSYLPVILALIGVIFFIVRKQWGGIILFLSYLGGWFLIKGQNDPLGFMYGYFQDNFPVFAQVFRWQSSKFWPFIALPLPVLATMGVLILTKKFHVRGKWIVGASITGLLLLYVFPLFQGYWMRESMYVQVPKEYFSLQAYLKENDPHSRMYLAPEANTLYFRNYGWGFWGSIFLNYVFPNPIVEKALVIGSAENEAAFTVMRNAYYSGDPLYFAATLNLYDTPLIFSDEYASEGNIGYRYDWDMHKQVIQDNPYFEKVWQEGKLSLYRIRKDMIIPVTEYATVAPGHQPSNLIANNAYYNNSHYIEQDSGILYPFALKFQEFSINDENQYLEAKTTYQGANNIFDWNANADILLQSPTSVKRTASTVALQPSFPRLRINDALYDFSVPHVDYTFATEKSLKFLSLDGEVMENRQGFLGHIQKPFTQSITNASLKAWTDESLSFDLLNRNNPYVIWCNNEPKTTDVNVTQKGNECGSGPIQLLQDAILQADIQFETRYPASVTLCIDSANKRTCVNPNTTAHFEQSFASSFVLPKVIEGNDTVKVFLKFTSEEKTETKIAITKFDLKVYGSSVQAQKSGEELTVVNSFTIPFETNDTIQLDIPLLQGNNAYRLNPRDAFIPNTAKTIYEAGIGSASIKQSVEDSKIIITNNESSASIYNQLPLFTGDGMHLAYVDGEHSSGIPAEIRVRNSKDEFFIWEQKLFSNRRSQFFDMVALPRNLTNYTLDIFSTSIGRRPSINAVSDVIFQVIPPVWGTMSLIPQNQTLSMSTIELQNTFAKDTNTYTGSIPNADSIFVTIPTAYSPYWVLRQVDESQSLDSLYDVYMAFLNGYDIDTSVQTANGWKQGWIVKNASNTKVVVIFWPNLLVYLGYAIIIGMLIALLIPWKLLKKGIHRLRKKNPAVDGIIVK